MRFLLDTSFIVSYLRRGGRWEEEIVRLRTNGEFAVSVITFGELYYGSLLARDPIKEKKKYESFLESFEVSIISLRTEAMRIYAQVRLDLEQEGKRLDDFDLLIGATAVFEGATLVTDDIKHFARFPKLEVYGKRGD